MNILHINKFHYIRGGSEMVYFCTSKLLESHGHRSIYFSMHHPENLSCETGDYFMPHLELNSNNNGIIGKVKTAGRIIYSLEAKKRLSKLLDQYTIDIAHLHNIYHHISPSILHELKERNIPVVMTLHDYKMVCTSYSMLNVNPCEACSGKRYFQAFKRKCVKHSYAKSLLGVLEMYVHHKILDIYENVDIFISPSMFLKGKFAEMGFSKNIVYLPNFIDTEKFCNNKIQDGDEGSIAYFGRLSAEKGLFTLLEAAKILNAKSKVVVNIIGDGPIRGELDKKVKMENIDNVKLLGYKKSEDLYREINRSQLVIIPSEWYENNPISILEAFALGKPVIGSRIGGIPELVKDGETGYTFEPGNAEELCEKIELLLTDRSLRGNLGNNAGRFVRSVFNPEKHYHGLMEIYKSAIERPRNPRRKTNTD